MEPRMDHPALAVPGAMDALQALGAAVGGTGLDPILVELVSLRASQINGCSVCVDGHPRIARKLGETDERLFACRRGENRLTSPTPNEPRSP